MATAAALPSSAGPKGFNLFDPPKPQRKPIPFEERNAALISRRYRASKGDRLVYVADSRKPVAVLERASFDIVLDLAFDTQEQALYGLRLRDGRTVLSRTKEGEPSVEWKLPEQWLAATGLYRVGEQIRLAVEDTRSGYVERADFFAGFRFLRVKEVAYSEACFTRTSASVKFTPLGAASGTLFDHDARMGGREASWRLGRLKALRNAPRVADEELPYSLAANTGPVAPWALLPLGERRPQRPSAQLASSGTFTMDGMTTCVQTLPVWCDFSPSGKTFASCWRHDQALGTDEGPLAGKKVPYYFPRGGVLPDVGSSLQETVAVSAAEQRVALEVIQDPKRRREPTMVWLGLDGPKPTFLGAAPGLVAHRMETWHPEAAKEARVTSHAPENTPSWHYREG